MKTTLLLLAVISLVAFSWEDTAIPMPDDSDPEMTGSNSALSVDFTDPFGSDGNPDAGMVYDDPTDDTEFTVTLLNTWLITYAGNVLGLDYYIVGGNPVIWFCSSVDDKLYLADIADMTQVSSSNLHSGNTSVFGNCITSQELTTTDYVSSNLYEGLGDSWDSYPNPAGDNSRGITNDGNNNCLWLTMTLGTSGNYDQYLGSMTQGNPGSIVWYPTDCPLLDTQYLSGLTDFVLYGGNTCLAYTIYNSQYVRFEEFTGSGLNYLGYAVLPISIDYSYGICYCNAHDSFFWSYYVGGNFFVSEFSVDDITALDQATWGHIKSSF